LKKPALSAGISIGLKTGPCKNGFGVRAKEKRGVFRYVEPENCIFPLASYSGAGAKDATEKRSRIEKSLSGKGIFLSEPFVRQRLG